MNELTYYRLSTQTYITKFVLILNLLLCVRSLLLFFVFTRKVLTKKGRVYNLFFNLSAKKN